MEKELYWKNLKIGITGNKPRTPLRSILEAILLMVAAGTIISIAGLNYATKQEEELKKAFSRSCGQYSVPIGEAQPNAIAREQFLRLRELYPKRFKKVSDEEGISQILSTYQSKTGKLLIPEYSCD